MTVQALYDLGIYPTLTLSAAQVRALDAGDIAELRELGATDAMIAHLRELGADPSDDRNVVLDFEAMTADRRGGR